MEYSIDIQTVFYLLVEWNKFGNKNSADCFQITIPTFGYYSQLTNNRLAVNHFIVLLIQQKLDFVVK